MIAEEVGRIGLMDQAVVEVGLVVEGVSVEEEAEAEGIPIEIEREVHLLKDLVVRPRI
jgi:hypothetical protein